MSRKFTSEDAVRFLYGEMDAMEREEFLDAILEDDALFEEFEALKAAQDGMVKVELAPSKAATERVMRVAKRAVKEKRVSASAFLSTGKERVMNFHHMVSVLMVVFTCLTAAAAMYAYQKLHAQSSSWEMTQTKVNFVDHQLDQRLEFARERLNNILEDRSEAIVPVHHDTYRLVNSNVLTEQEQEVVLINLK